MSDIFISYSQSAGEPTAALAAALVERGYKPWYDANLLPGQAFGPVIDRAIDNARAVIVIWSLPAIASTWVLAEAARGMHQGKLISLRTADVSPAHLPTPYNSRHVSLCTDVDQVVAALFAMGIRPLVQANDLPGPEQLALDASRDWRALVTAPHLPIDIEAFLDVYRVLPMYRAMAERRLAMLRSGPVPATMRLVDSRDVYLRLDPRRHTAMVRRITATPDGALLATASYDKTVKIWSGNTATLVRTLRPAMGRGDAGRVYSAALHPQGQWCAVGGWSDTTPLNGHVLIFDLRTGSVITHIDCAQSVPLELEISPDGKLLAIGQNIGGVTVHDTESWQPIFTDRNYDDSVCSLSFADAYPSKLAASSFDGRIRLYSHDWHCRAAQAPGGLRCYGLSFSPDGSCLAVGYDDRARIDILDSETLTPIRELDVSTVRGDTASIAFLADGRIASGGRKGNLNGEAIQFHSPKTNEIHRAHLAPAAISDLAPLSRHALAFGTATGAFGIVGEDGSPLFVCAATFSNMRCISGKTFALSTDGTRVRFGLGTDEAAPVLFDVTARKLYDFTDEGADLHCADTESIDVRGWNGGMTPTLRLGDREQRLMLSRHETAWSFAVSPDHRSFALGSEWRVRLYDCEGAELWECASPAPCLSIAFTGDGKFFAAAYGDGTIRWHRTTTGDEVLSLFVFLPDGLTGSREWLLFTPEGYYDASSPVAENVIGWHINRGTRVSADFFPFEAFATAFKRADIIDCALVK